MAQTNAERQAEYKKRTRQDGRQLNMWISGEAYLALARMARHHGTSKKELLQRLILEHDEEIRQGLDDQRFEKYMDVT